MAASASRIFYLAQVDVQPPRFVLFVNKTHLMADTYKKYLINQFREAYGFLGSPIQFFLKGRSPKEDKSERSAPAPDSPLESLAENEELVFETPDIHEDELSEEEISKLDPSYF